MLKKVKLEVKERRKTGRKMRQARCRGRQNERMDRTRDRTEFVNRSFLV